MVANFYFYFYYGRQLLLLLVLCEMQSVSSTIWTCVAVSISYDDNHYTTGTSLIDNTCVYHRFPFVVFGDSI